MLDRHQEDRLIASVDQTERNSPDFEGNQNPQSQIIGSNGFEGAAFQLEETSNTITSTSSSSPDVLKTSLQLVSSPSASIGGARSYNGIFQTLNSSGDPPGNVHFSLPGAYFVNMGLQVQMSSGASSVSVTIALVIHAIGDYSGDYSIIGSCLSRAGSLALEYDVVSLNGAAFLNTQYAPVELSIRAWKNAANAVTITQPSLVNSGLNGDNKTGQREWVLYTPANLGGSFGDTSHGQMGSGAP